MGACKGDMACSHSVVGAIVMVGLAVDASSPCARAIVIVMQDTIDHLHRIEAIVEKFSDMQADSTRPTAAPWTRTSL